MLRKCAILFGTKKKNRPQKQKTFLIVAKKMQILSISSSCVKNTFDYTSFDLTLTFTQIDFNNHRCINLTKNKIVYQAFDFAFHGTRNSDKNS